MAKSSIQPPVGEVVLVQKAATVEQPKIREISQKQYEKLRPKKPLSEKQQENLKKLVERNKQRAIERRTVVKDAVPESIPEDQELVIVKPKRKYTRKPKNEIVQPTDSEPETATESESEPEVRKPVPLKRSNTKPKKAAPKKAPPKYKYDTETTSNDEWSDEDNSEDEDYEDPRVQKYQAKAQARIQAVQQIDKRIQQLKTNPYQNRDLGVF